MRNGRLSRFFLQDYAAGLYRFLGLSVGAEFSAADVALLYRKVFHLPSSSDEARAAMRKVNADISVNLGGEKTLIKPSPMFEKMLFFCLFQAALGGKNWLCVGKNVLDVLLEMEREREKQEKVAVNTSSR